mmetsp:Transcript_26796/g.77267  ORF Transcript_26796/g.77267 Transcript_26796/m.77267 type:complete len:238 (+) Transcript_26796:542-1255(+)
MPYVRASSPNRSMSPESSGPNTSHAASRIVPRSGLAAACSLLTICTVPCPSTSGRNGILALELTTGTLGRSGLLNRTVISPFSLSSTSMSSAWPFRLTSTLPESRSRSAPTLLLGGVTWMESFPRTSCTSLSASRSSFWYVGDLSRLISVGALSSTWMVRVGSMAEDAKAAVLVVVSATEGAGRPVSVPKARAADRDAAAMHCFAPSIKGMPPPSSLGSLRMQRPMDATRGDDLAVG